MVLHAPSRRTLLRKLLLLTLLVGEVVALSGWRFIEPQAQVGYLVKLGNRYLVAYRDQYQHTRITEHATLDGAIRFTEQTLNLQRGHGSPMDEIEYAWWSDRSDTFQVQWKLTYYEPLHRMSFSDQKDGRYFLESFRNGAYSRSPFGHAILLVPNLSTRL